MCVNNIQLHFLIHKTFKPKLYVNIWRRSKCRSPSNNCNQNCLQLYPSY